MKITNGADMKRSANAKIITYSKPGDGKTTVAGLLPGKTLVFDIDGTSQVLEGYSNVDIAKIDGEDAHNSIIQFYGYAKANIQKYDNIFIDNLTHYQKLWLLNKGEKTKSGMPELKDYAILDNHLLKLVEIFNALDANVIYTTWETTREIIHDDGQKYNQFLPDIRDKIVNHIMGINHVVARLVRKADGERGFILEGNQTIFAKNHLDARKGCLQKDLILPSTQQAVEEPKKFKRDAYYYHPESDTFVEFKKGDVVPDENNLEFGHCNPITKEKYDKGIQEQNAVTPKNTKQNGDN